MALFKILRGESSRIDTTITPIRDGYAYFVKDTAGFYIDTDIDGVKKRTKINKLEVTSATQPDNIGVGDDWDKIL